MDDLIRASSLQGFDELVGVLGGAPDALRRSDGLEAGAGHDPDVYFAYSTLAALLHTAATTLRCPDLGLRLAGSQGIDVLGAVALIARHAPTAEAAIDGLRRYSRFYSPAFTVGVRRLDDHRSRYTFRIVVEGIDHPAQVLELSLGVSLDLFRILLGDDFRPRGVLLPHAPVSSPERYRDYFGAPVRFGAGECGFDVDRADLGRRRAGDDPRLRELTERYLETAAGPDLDAQVRELIRRCLPTGQTSLITVSDHLRVHPRTLQRHLRRTGTSFELLLDDVRRGRAEQYLHHTDRPVGQIAAMLGYSEQSTLTRAARRWFGESPARIRARRSRED